MEDISAFFSVTYVTQFIFAFLMTLIVESNILLLLWRKSLGASKILKTSLIINGFSLPYVWFIFPIVIENHVFSVFSSELFAVIAETLLLKEMLTKFDWKTAFMTSLLMNIASFTVGLLYYSIVRLF